MVFKATEKNHTRFLGRNGHRRDSFKVTKELMLKGTVGSFYFYSRTF